MPSEDAEAKISPKLSGENAMPLTMPECRSSQNDFLLPIISNMSVINLYAAIAALQLQVIKIASSLTF